MRTVRVEGDYNMENKQMKTGDKCTECDGRIALINSVDNSEIQFRCPLTVEVGIDVEYDRHVSCFEME